MSNDVCSRPRCKRPTEIIVDGVPLCDKHWEEHIQKLEERRTRELREE
ncbi:MAG: hypothetical protein PHI12_11095 [Dehalococcoidales bacterium]|nr:hypothetical protein [Candidatus Thermoplasmatota archaeon]MDD5511334.1 hypothetical protein [Dehalococcoidales bacterium]